MKSWMALLKNLQRMKATMHFDCDVNTTVCVIMGRVDSY